jgi:hypothetical protein
MIYTGIPLNDLPLYPVAIEGCYEMTVALNMHTKKLKSSLKDSLINLTSQV